MKPPTTSVAKIMKGLNFGLLTCGPAERRVIKRQTRRAVRRSECQLCKGTGMVGDCGPGVKGNDEFQPCQCST